MEWLTNLWLPILAAAGAIFVASMIVCAILPIHKKDYKKFGPAEESVLTLVRSSNLTPGQYMFPDFDPAKMKDPAVEAKFKAGPWGFMMVMPGPWSMGKTLGLWLV